MYIFTMIYSGREVHKVKPVFTKVVLLVSVDVISATAVCDIRIVFVSV